MLLAHTRIRNHGHKQLSAYRRHWFSIFTPLFKSNYRSAWAFCACWNLPTRRINQGLIIQHVPWTSKKFTRVFFYWPLCGNESYPLGRSSPCQSRGSILRELKSHFSIKLCRESLRNEITWSNTSPLCRCYRKGCASLPRIRTHGFLRNTRYPQYLQCQRSNEHEGPVRNFPIH